VACAAISAVSRCASLIWRNMRAPTRKAHALVVEYRPLEIHTVPVLEYLVLILLVSQAVCWLERRLQTGDR
jgi:polar amino acid transport system permease protein